MFEQNPLNLYAQELKKHYEIQDSLNKNLGELNEEKRRTSPQEYERLYSRDEQEIHQYMDKVNSEITKLKKVMDSYYDAMEASERLENLEKIVPRDKQEQEELEKEKKYFEELKNKNMEFLPNEVKELFVPSQSTLEETVSQEKENIKEIDDYRKEIEKNEKEIKHLKENIEELISLKGKIPESEYERDLAMLKRYKNRENGKLLRNRQIVTAYELLKNNQERITDLNSLIVRDEQDAREIQEELNFLRNENEQNKRFIPKTLHQSLVNANRKNPIQQDTTKSVLQTETNNQSMSTQTPEISIHEELVQPSSSSQSNESKPTEQFISPENDNSYIPNFSMINPEVEEFVSEEARQEMNSPVREAPTSYIQEEANQSTINQTEEILDFSKSLKEFEGMEKTKTMPIGIPSENIRENSQSKNESETEKINDIFKHFDRVYTNLEQEDSKEKDQSSETIIVEPADGEEEKHETTSTAVPNYNDDEPGKEYSDNFKEPMETSSEVIEDEEEDFDFEDEDEKDSNKKLEFWNRHNNQGGFVEPDEFDDDELEEVVGVRKPKKNIKKRIIFGIGTVITILGAIATGHFMQKKSNIANQTKVEDSITEEDLEILEEEPQTEEKELETLEEETKKVDSESELQYVDEAASTSKESYVGMIPNEANNIVNTNDIRLGNTVKIDPTAGIHSNTFDAYLNENAQSQYFKNNPDRVVIGVSILNQNGLEIVYAYTPDANNKINQLINEGGDIVSILTANKEKYLQSYDGSSSLIDAEVKAYAEGWFNINSVQTQNTKGLQR